MQLREQIRLKKELQTRYPQSEVSLHFDLHFENGKFTQAPYALVSSGVNTVRVEYSHDESVDDILSRIERAPANVNAANVLKEVVNDTGRI